MTAKDDISNYTLDELIEFAFWAKAYIDFGYGIYWRSKYQECQDRITQLT